MGNRIGLDISTNLIRVACFAKHESKGKQTQYDETESPVIIQRAYNEGIDGDNMPYGFNPTKMCPSGSSNFLLGATSSSSASPDAASSTAILQNETDELQLVLRIVSDLVEHGLARSRGDIEIDAEEGCAYSGTFCFLDVNMTDFAEVVHELSDLLEGRVLEATGSGVSQMMDRLKEPPFEKLKITLNRHREIACVLEAIDFLLCYGPSNVFHYKETHRAINAVSADPKHYIVRTMEGRQSEIRRFYPFMLANVKYGVSYHHVTAPGESSRIGGSTIGGATFMGLSRLICEEASDSESAIKLAVNGDNSKVDMLVKDIYGGDYPAIGLSGQVIASSFGKMQPSRKSQKAPPPQKAAIAEGEEAKHFALIRMGGPQTSRARDRDRGRDRTGRSRRKRRHTVSIAATYRRHVPTASMMMNQQTENGSAASLSPGGWSRQVNLPAEGSSVHPAPTGPPSVVSPEARSAFGGEREGSSLFHMDNDGEEEEEDEFEYDEDCGEGENEDEEAEDEDELVSEPAPSLSPSLSHSRYANCNGSESGMATVADSDVHTFMAPSEAPSCYWATSEGARSSASPSASFGNLGYAESVGNVSSNGQATTQEGSAMANGNSHSRRGGEKLLVPPATKVRGQKGRRRRLQSPSPCSNASTNQCPSPAPTVSEGPKGRIPTSQSAGPLLVPFEEGRDGPARGRTEGSCGERGVTIRLPVEAFDATKPCSERGGEGEVGDWFPALPTRATQSCFAASWREVGLEEFMKEGGQGSGNGQSRGGEGSAGEDGMDAEKEESDSFLPSVSPVASAGYSARDLAKSLLTMMCFNIAQLAFFNAVVFNCPRIVFVGQYLNLPEYLSSIQHSIHYWSQGKCKATFVNRAPFLGAMGACLRQRTRKESAVRYSAADHQDVTHSAMPPPHRLRLFLMGRSEKKRERQVHAWRQHHQHQQTHSESHSASGAGEGEGGSTAFEMKFQESPHGNGGCGGAGERESSRPPFSTVDSTVQSHTPSPSPSPSPSGRPPSVPPSPCPPSDQPPCARSGPEPKVLTESPRQKSKQSGAAGEEG